jgi:hypothetical protein
MLTVKIKNQAALNNMQVDENEILKLIGSK